MNKLDITKNKKVCIFDFDSTLSSIHLYHFIYTPNYRQKQLQNLHKKDFIKWDESSQKILLKLRINDSDVSDVSDLLSSSPNFCEYIFGGKNRVLYLTHYLDELIKKDYDLFISSRGNIIDIISTLKCLFILNKFVAIHAHKGQNWFIYKTKTNKLISSNNLYNKCEFIAHIECLFGYTDIIFVDDTKSELESVRIGINKIKTITININTPNIILFTDPTFEFEGNGLNECHLKSILEKSP